MLAGLREAEARQLRTLQKELAQLQEQIDLLVLRQAGHNLDNLSILGADAPEDADRERLAGLAGRGAAEDVDLARLTPAQGQTERNTRSIAAAAEEAGEQGGGAEAAAKLVRAAGRMERAMVELRKGQAAEAYPPQDEALTALTEAKTLVDEKKQQVDQDLADQQKGAIRERYIEIRQQQATLNETTQELAGDGEELGRRALQRLGQLPGQQGALADEVEAVGEDLATLGSVVYQWANQDLRATMNDVKDRLGDQDVGPGTLGSQRLALAQLDAMIENLKVRPPQDDFERQAGGQGQGQGGEQPPQLPGSVELRLLRDLQLALADRTEAADAADADAEELARLGGREGELRNVLDEMLKKASDGKLGLGPEPAPEDRLPEEAGEAEIEQDELMGELLGGAEADAGGEEKLLDRIGDRMGRVRQRLTLDEDAGETTVLLARKAAEDFDELVEQAESQERQQQQQQQQQAGGQQQQGEQQQLQPEQQQANAGQQPAGQQPQQGQPRQQPGEGDNAGDGRPPEGQDPALDGGDIAGRQDETWAKLTPRQRAAIIEGSGEQTLREYEQLVADYYKGLAQKAQEDN